MAVNSVGSTNTTNTTTSTTTTTTGESSLGIDDFFTLLSAQLQNQDMFNSQSDTEFIAQMAQFSSLQQMKDLVAQYQNNYSVSLIGKNVAIENDTTEVAGLVEGVAMKDGEAYLEINGEYYNSDDVTYVANPIVSESTVATDTTTE